MDPQWRRSAATLNLPYGSALRAMPEREAGHFE
jgi:hypothetical protein